ncbi:hypothetical protein E2542_SST22687 [Spatholobus suberectus]|nr:hypothetical protein E2542_SST22687 [Spatholobus suberectus]
MANKYVALLLVCLVLAVGVEAREMDEKQRECYSYCHSACIYPGPFCKWWCGGRCENPILWGSAHDHASKRFPVPTENDYKAHPINFDG